ncbi:ragulator complex protein LAMTOR2 homolog [Hyalella azteca]|uniref:Ragulator complex protein LAMTOR2 homolog n=1 Tax=Hyalella azteca TaxID=294128 RepID=A0A8B7NNL3_HYAAZ|nr:ragulator complex protein LAMTOR2 homolog [Hyalella azteca]
MAMLKPAALTQLLNEANTGGVYGALLLNMDGALLAFSGPADRDARVTAAISSNIWAAYSKLGATGRAQSPLAPATPEQRLLTVLLDCQVTNSRPARLPGD